jgi:hypothetical protein
MSRRNRRIARPLAVVIVGFIFGGVLAGGLFPGGFAATSFAASEDDSGIELLARAREAATSYDFTGEVMVEWHDDGRVQRERVPVRETRGVLRVGEARKIIGAGDDRLMARDGVWKRLWVGPSGSAGTELAVVDPERKYSLIVTDGPRTAGRDTILIKIGRGGRVSERFVVDDVTGLLLRREQLDTRGRVERAVRFVELSELTPTSASPTVTGPRGEGSAPKAITKSATNAVAAKRLGHGFTLTGRYRAADGSVHHYYSDGIYAASVFAQAGELDRQELPDDATSTDFSGRRLASYSTPSGTVVVWADDDHVYTLVSDAPKRDLDAMMNDLPGPAADDAGEQMTEFVLAPFRW